VRDAAVATTAIEPGARIDRRDAGADGRSRLPHAPSERGRAQDKEFAKLEPAEIAAIERLYVESFGAT